MRARRSCLSVPGSSAKMLEKARGIPADELVLDLEDAVAADDKEAARATVVAALAAGFGERTVSVRVNAVGTAWFERDVLEVVRGAAGRLDCLTIPKVESPADVAAVAGLLERAEGEAPAGRAVGLEALIETAAGLAGAVEIARASPRLEALILGYADLGASLGLPAESSGAGDRWHFARGAVIVAARAAGIQAIDGPWLEMDDAAGLEREAGRAHALGFDGKWAIHPSQLEPLNARFAPAPDEVERARAVLTALADGAGAARLDGAMIDEASRKHAAQVVARAEAAARR